MALDTLSWAGLSLLEYSGRRRTLRWSARNSLVASKCSQKFMVKSSCGSCSCHFLPTTFLRLAASLVRAVLPDSVRVPDIYTPSWPGGKAQHAFQSDGMFDDQPFENLWVKMVANILMVKMSKICWIHILKMGPVLITCRWMERPPRLMW